jgi:hypothetical protein
MGHRYQEVETLDRWGGGGRDWSQSTHGPGAVNLKTSQGLSLASQVTHSRLRGSPKLRGPYRRFYQQGPKHNLVQVVISTASKKVNNMLLCASE